MVGTSFLLFLLMVLTTGVDTIPLEDFYPFGAGAGNTEHTVADGGDSSRPIPLPSQLNFFGQFYDDIFVNTHGNLSPGDGFMDWTPRDLPINNPIIAVYWADSDPRPPNGGNIWYGINSTEALLQQALGAIQCAYPSVSSIDFLLIATWDHIGYHRLGFDKTNTFQCVLAVSGTQSYAIYLYADGLIQWTTGDDSGGMGGLGGTPALAGYADKTTTSYTIPGSQTDAILGIASTTNIDVPGMWVFRFDEEELVPPNCDQNIHECRLCKDITTFGVYMWPETRGRRTISLPCQLDSTINVTRDCLNDTTWGEPAYDDCRLLILGELINEDNLGDTTVAVASAVQRAKQTASNAQLVREVIVSTAKFAINDTSLVDEELVGNIVDVLDGLQQWPVDVVQADDNGAEIVESFEIIAISLSHQENFTKLIITNENVAVSIQNVDLDDIKTGISLSVSEGEGSLTAAICNNRTLAPDEIASALLPLSLYELFDSNEESVPFVFSVLRSGSLFSIEGNQGDVEDLDTSVGSPVVSLTTGVNRAFQNLLDPVTVNVRILVQNFTNPRCVSYDFDQQVWVMDGCTTMLTSDSNLITCKCNHLTNVACLVDICSRTEEECGFCSYDEDNTFDVYMWPRTRGGKTASLPCRWDSTINITRTCLNDGRWNEPAYDVCNLLIPREEINEDNLGETTMAVALAVQQVEQTNDNALLVRDVIALTAMFAIKDIYLVDEEVIGNVVEVLDGLQQWPADTVQTDNSGAEIVKSFEIIAISLAQQENFTELTITNENVAVSIQNIDLDDIITGGISLSVSEREGSLNAAIGNDSTLAPDEIASGLLPPSLFVNEPFDSNVPIVLAVLRSGDLFSIEGNQGDVEGLETLVGSPVVSLTAGVNRTFRQLSDPVIVNVRILVQNFTNPRCVSYDFNRQVWVTDGCTTIQTSESDLITCKCDHLTNFASLVDICSRTEDDGCGQSDDAQRTLDVISIIGVILSVVSLILTILTLLLFTKLRMRDASKFHVQLSLSLLGMLVVFVVGIDRTDVFEGCVTVSVLIHYFTLVAVMWMGAEAVLMFQKLVIIFVQITTRYIIIVSLVCWLAPIIPAVIPAAIDPNLVVTNTDTNKFCFIGDNRVFFAAFLGPIFAILLFNAVIFVIIIVALIRHTRNKLDKIGDPRQQRKSNIRLAMSLFGIMALFGLTWGFGAFTISEASLPFQIMFAIFNSLQGLFIFSHFCALSDDVRQLWLEKLTCGRYVTSKSSSISGGKKNHTTGQLDSGVKEKTLTCTTPVPYATDSSIELSEKV